MTIATIRLLTACTMRCGLGTVFGETLSDGQ